MDGPHQNKNSKHSGCLAGIDGWMVPKGQKITKNVDGWLDSPQRGTNDEKYYWMLGWVCLCRDLFKK